MKTRKHHNSLPMVSLCRQFFKNLDSPFWRKCLWLKAQQSEVLDSLPQDLLCSILPGFISKAVGASVLPRKWFSNITFLSKCQGSGKKGSKINLEQRDQCWLFITSSCDYGITNSLWQEKWKSSQEFHLAIYLEKIKKKKNLNRSMAIWEHIIVHL